MLGIGCPDRHALPRITSLKMHRPQRVLPPARAGSFIGATLSFPRVPAKVPSPSDLPTFVIVHCQRVVFEFTIGQRVAALPADLRAEVDTDDDGKRPRPIGQAGQIPAADVPFARGTVAAGK